MNPARKDVGLPRLLVLALVVLSVTVAESAEAQEATPSVSDADTTLDSTPILGVAGDTLLDDRALRIEPFVDVALEHEGWIPSVLQRHRPIRSLVSEDFRDLSFLRDVVGDRSLVHVGESGHGMAEFNHLKVRLVKYLHRELGFDVLAIESSFWGCWDADRRAAELSPEAFMRACAVPVWQTREIVEIFRYARETRGPWSRSIRCLPNGFAGPTLRFSPSIVSAVAPRTPKPRAMG